MKRILRSKTQLLLFLSLLASLFYFSGFCLPAKNIGRANTLLLDTLPVGNFSQLNVTDSTLPTVGPELSLQGFRQHWRMGIDVANHGGSEDFVIVARDVPRAGVRDHIYINDNKTGDNSINDTTEDPTIGFFITPTVSGIQTLFNVPDTHPNRAVVGIRKSQFTTVNGSYLAFYNSASDIPVMKLNSSLEFTPFLKAQGVISVLSSNINNTNYLDLNANPTDGSTDFRLKDYFNSSNSQYSFQITNAAATTNYLSINQSSNNVGINCSNPASALTVNGALACVQSKTDNLNCQNLKINNVANWCDYVFDKDYHLPSTGETESFIRKFGHLPGMPSAEEVQEDGINVVKIQKALLQQIEQLTLYSLNREKRITELESKNAALLAQLQLEIAKINSDSK